MILYTNNGQISVSLNCIGSAILMKCWDNFPGDDYGCQTSSLLTAGAARSLSLELAELADEIDAKAQEG